jgi:hypothetical protein
VQSARPSASFDPATLTRDPAWFPHHLRTDSGTIEFVHLTRAAHRGVTFLADDYFDSSLTRVTLPLRDAVPAAAALPQQPLHFIFHSAFCGSTLLTRLLDIEGVSMGLKEPAGLNDLADVLRRSGRRIDIRPTLAALLTLYARPMSAGEVMIVKPSNVANAVIDDALALRPDAGALLLYSPLPAFLRSLASKGLFARVWARKLGFALAMLPEIDPGFSDQDRWLQTDLQVAALGWLQQQAQFARLVRTHGSRILTADSTSLLADLPNAMARLADFFGLDRAALKAAANSPARFEDSKRHGLAFDAEARASAQATAQAAYGDEIDKVVTWAEAVARHCGVPMTLDCTLLS